MSWPPSLPLLFPIFSLHFLVLSSVTTCSCSPHHSLPHCGHCLPKLTFTGKHLAVQRRKSTVRGCFLGVEREKERREMSADTGIPLFQWHRNKKKKNFLESLTNNHSKQAGSDSFLKVGLENDADIEQVNAEKGIFTCVLSHYPETRGKVRRTSGRDTPCSANTAFPSQTVQGWLR